MGAVGIARDKVFTEQGEIRTRGSGVDSHLLIVVDVKVAGCWECSFSTQ